MKITTRIVILNVATIAIIVGLTAGFILSRFRSEFAHQDGLVTEFIFVVVAQAAVFSLLSAFLVGRALAPLKTMADTLKEITGSDLEITDLRKRLDENSGSEVAVVAREINNLMEKMEKILVMIVGAIDRINNHAATIAATVDMQAGFASQLSTSVVEISTTMEEFSSTAGQIAHHSQGVVEIADETLQQTKTGATGVETLTMKMTEISQDNEANLRDIVELGRKSKEITKVMEIINTIANRTKLIAFNAALEAASAGEAGKRFGVVAVEIRRLADSVVESIGEIEGKVTEIMDSVSRLVLASEKSSQGIHQGLDYSAQTMTLLIDVVDGAERTTDAAKHISLSTQQQQTASSQVVIALREIQEGTRHSTASMQEVAVIANDLAALSGRLHTLVDAFRVTEKSADAAAGF